VDMALQKTSAKNGGVWGHKMSREWGRESDTYEIELAILPSHISRKKKDNQ
jgi:hypothetical protein